MRERRIQPLGNQRGYRRPAIVLLKQENYRIIHCAMYSLTGAPIDYN